MPDFQAQNRLQSIQAGEYTGSETSHYFEEFVERGRLNSFVYGNIVSIKLADSAHLQVEWFKVAGLQVLLAHTYFSFENEMIPDVVQTKVPQW